MVTGGIILISIIASDMDGTLLNDKMQISDGNLTAIKAAQTANIEFVIATGRSRHEVLPLLTGLEQIPAMITMNGAQVFNQAGESVFDVAIDKDTVRTLIDYLHAHGIYFELATNQGNYSDSKVHHIQNVADLLVNLNPDTSYKIAVALSASRLELMNINYVTDGYTKLLTDPDIKIYKLIAFSNATTPDLTPVKELCDQQSQLIGTSSSSNNIEINHVDAQKGIALAAYADSQNVPIEATMSIGDNLNDFSMIKVAGIGVAMANAVPTIKGIANYQTNANVLDGVARAIHHAQDINQQAEKMWLDANVIHSKNG